MERKILKQIAREEKKYERETSEIRKNRIIKKIRSLLNKMRKKGYEIPTELETI